ncbi:glutamic acid-rich protein-like [Saccostrea echinata]|uniref:glutamic acid-rich protein-like n=1 Tax=Saccostrea echinata TaxID=191078 RepID=UPI002A813713|nr:glutamic acid-rich protein-like [Saccostrea echinata]
MPRCACGTYFSADSETEDEEDEWETPWLKQWAEENQKFVKTKACRLVESKLHLNRIVLVGEAGCGKSAIAKNIALKYMALKWKIVDVKSLNDIKNAPVKTKSVLFVVNDPIGKSDIDEKLFRLWHLQKEMLDDYSRKNKEGDNKVKLPKVIVTCRSNLLENDREFIMSGFTIINLDKDEARLTQKEKEYILKRHIDCSELENNELNQILLTDKSFPLLSSIVSTSKTLQENILKFFSEPFDQLNREILLLRENSKEKYLCLLLLILHGNKLSKHSFHDETEDRESLEYMNDEKEDDDDNNDDDEDEDDDNKDEDDDDDDDDDDEDDDDDDDDDENDCEIIDEKMLNDLFETLNLRKGISQLRKTLRMAHTWIYFFVLGYLMIEF